MGRLLTWLVAIGAALPALAFTVGLCSLALRPVGLELPDPALTRALKSVATYDPGPYAPAETFATSVLTAIDPRVAAHFVTETLDRASLSQLELLHAPQVGITRLEGLQACRSLTGLTLAENDLVSLRPLEPLSGLVRVDVRQNRLRDLRPLAGNPRLTTLLASDNALTSIAPLAYLNGLTTLDLAGNALTSLVPLANAQQLTDLDASRNQIASLAGLQGQPWLARIDLAQNEITDLSLLRSLSALAQLDLAGNALSSLEGLGSFPSLTTASFGGVFADLRPLQRCGGITSLTLESDHLAELQPLNDLPHLESLTLICDGPLDLTPLADHPTLRRLRIETDQLRAVRGLTACTRLEILSIGASGEFPARTALALPVLGVLLLENVTLSDAPALTEHPILSTLALRHVTLTPTKEPSSAPTGGLAELRDAGLQILSRDAIALPGITEFQREARPSSAAFLSDETSIPAN